MRFRVLILLESVVVGRKLNEDAQDSQLALDPLASLVLLDLLLGDGLLVFALLECSGQALVVLCVQLVVSTCSP